MIGKTISRYRILEKLVLDAQAMSFWDPERAAGSRRQYLGEKICLEVLS